MLKEKFIISCPVLYSPYPNYYTAGKTGVGKGTPNWSKEKYEAEKYDSYGEAVAVIDKFIIKEEEWFQVEKVFVVSGTVVGISS